jgi:hypothetical protein
MRFSWLLSSRNGALHGSRNLDLQQQQHNSHTHTPYDSKNSFLAFFLFFFGVDIENKHLWA